MILRFRNHTRLLPIANDKFGRLFICFSDEPLVQCKRSIHICVKIQIHKIKRIFMLYGTVITEFPLKIRRLSCICLFISKQNKIEIHALKKTVSTMQTVRILSVLCNTMKYEISLSHCLKTFIRMVLYSILETITCRK